MQRHTKASLLADGAMRRLRHVAELAGSQEARERRRRERFLAAAARHAPLVAVDDDRGNRYLIRPTDRVIGRGLFVERQFDVSVIDQALALLAARDVNPSVVLDVGANIGTTLVDVLVRLPQARGIALEPDPANFALLRHNVLANGLEERATLIQAAATDGADSVTLELSQENFGDHRVRIGEPAAGVFQEHQRTTQSVPGRSLDSLAGAGLVDPGPGTVVWMDIQGFEGHALSAAHAFVKAGSPIVVEFWPYGLDRVAGFERFLEAAGRYSAIFRLSDRPGQLALDELAGLAQELRPSHDHANLLLV